MPVQSNRQIDLLCANMKIRLFACQQMLSISALCLLFLYGAQLVSMTLLASNQWVIAL